MILQDDISYTYYYASRLIEFNMFEYIDIIYIDNLPKKKKTSMKKNISMQTSQIMFDSIIYLSMVDILFVNLFLELKQ